MSRLAGWQDWQAKRAKRLRMVPDHPASSYPAPIEIRGAAGRETMVSTMVFEQRRSL